MKRHLFIRCMAVLLVFVFSVLAADTAVLEAKKVDYSKYSNQKICFGLGLHTDHTPPSANRPAGVKLIDYDTYFYDFRAQKKKKEQPVVYLTFDCGYENGLTKKFLKVLKKQDIKAIFFVTEAYIKSKPELVKQMKKQGHLVGNHTCSHPQLTSCSVKRMKQEIRQCAKTMKQKTGYKMDPYMRPPEGVYSERVIKVMQDLGYTTVLWSLAYLDYDESHQPGKDYVLQKFQKHHFNGMIPLLHAVSKSNLEALPEVIAYLKKKGYRFGTMDELTGRDKNER